MNFALKQMKLMGWSEGKGLGADESGIIKPIKPDIQMDKRGFGFTVEDSIQLKNQWWSEAYNAACKGLQTEYKISSVGVIVKSKKRGCVLDENEDNQTSSVYNNRFVSEKPNQEDTQSKCDHDDNNSKKKKKRKHSKEESQTISNIELSTENKEDTDKQKSSSIDFNQVFAKADKMTCHKAARLGIKMSGKMKRIEEQEAAFLKKFSKN